MARTSAAFIVASYSAMRATKRVLIGSLAAASASASLATCDRHAVDLEHDAAGLDAADPEFRRALARAHAHFERLLRHRHVREDADPDPAGALHVAGERAARGLDLARGDALGLQRLQAVLAEGERRRRVARPWMRPLCALRNLVRFGCSMTYVSSDPSVLRPRRGADGRRRLRPASCPAPSGRAP